MIVSPARLSPGLSTFPHQMLFGFSKGLGEIGRKEVGGDEEDRMVLTWLGALGPSRRSSLTLLCVTLVLTHWRFLASSCTFIIASTWMDTSL